MPGSPAPGTVGYNLYIPGELHLWLKHRAADEHIPMSRLIIRFCQEARTRLDAIAWAEAAECAAVDGDEPD